MHKQTKIAMLLIAGSTAIGSANPAPVAPVLPPSIGKTMLKSLGSPIADGALLLNTRLRYEYADQAGLDTSNALTFRNRLGYQTGIYSGFSLLAEGEYNWVLNSSEFAAYPPTFNNGDTVIADGETFDMNRLFVKYAKPGFIATVGRQDINLLNQRFIGTVAWRQNDQTFDAARIQYTGIPKLSLDYTYNWGVNRIFGTNAPTTALRRFRADNHFLNATYTGVPGVSFSSYAYLLGLRNATASSSNTFGLLADGLKPLCDAKYSLKYRAEWAYQEDNTYTSGTDLSEQYFHFLGALVREKYEVGLGFESLGGSGKNAFQTPLATLHLFNGWTDTFLTTPNGGLNDYYAYAVAPLSYGIMGRLEAHYYTAEKNSTVYGQEVGVSLVKKINANLTALVKASEYMGEGMLAGVKADKSKIWLQLDYTF